MIKKILYFDYEIESLMFLKVMTESAASFLIDISCSMDHFFSLLKRDNAQYDLIIFHAQAMERKRIIDELSKRFLNYVEVTSETHPSDHNITRILPAPFSFQEFLAFLVSQCN